MENCQNHETKEGLRSIDNLLIQRYAASIIMLLYPLARAEIRCAVKLRCVLGAVKGKRSIMSLLHLQVFETDNLHLQRIRLPVHSYHKVN